MVPAHGGRPRAAPKGYSSKSLGREDDYIDAYFGREDDHKEVKHQPALEVVTRACQMLFHRFKGPDGWINHDDYIRDDPEMVDLVIGMLFHYDPPTGGIP